MNRQRPLPRHKERALLGARVGSFQMPAKGASCGKRRCTSYDQAVAYALWLARKTTTPLRIYRCDTCHGWHLTKRTTWKDDPR